MTRPLAARPLSPATAHPRAAIKGALLLVALALLSVMGHSWAVVPVRVEVDGHVLEGDVLSGTVAGVLSQLGVTLREGDETEPPLDRRVAPGQVISVLRAFPVHLKVDGTERRALVVGGNVADLLEREGITLGPLDYVVPEASTALSPDMTVRVVRVREEIVVRQAPIPYRTLRWAEPRWERGKTGVLRAGKEGLAEYTERLRYEDGQLVSTERLASRVLVQPQDEIIGVGTRIVWRTLETPLGTIRYREARQMVATAYYPGPESTGRYADGLTATGMRAGHGVVAVDPKVIPLGTRLYIPGYGMAVAGDVGSAIKGNRIDLGFNTLREALHFGRRTVTVYVLD
ncbi:MAG TPA: 3D domain-containing protein [Limnochordales bacterium]